MQLSNLDFALRIFEDEEGKVLTSTTHPKIKKGMAAKCPKAEIVNVYSTLASANSKVVVHCEAYEPENEKNKRCLKDFDNPTACTAEKVAQMLKMI